jgi:PAS domain S-box-containing protein
VRAILQDRVGFLWVGTADGLSRYDGRRFRTFRHDPRDPRSLGPGVVMALHESRDGMLWVGLNGSGLSRFDPGTETFRHYRHDPKDPLSLSQDDVTDVAQDRAGALWVATSRGLNRFEPDREGFTRFHPDPQDPESVGGDEVTSLALDPAGALWVGTADGGLNRLSLESGRARFERWRHDPRDPRSLASDNVESVLVDRKGRVWAGTWGAGLQRYDASQKAFVRGTRAAWTRSDERVQDLLEDHRGAVWVATWGSGLLRIDPATNEATRHEPDASDPAGLSHGNVAALFEDRRGLLWIGTGGGGLNSLDLRGQPFQTLVPRGAGVHDVRAVLEDREGRLWAGTAGGGLLRLDRTGAVQERYRHAASDPGSLSDDNVMALLEDRDGRLWVGTMGGLDRLDRARGRFTHYRHDPGRPTSLSHDNVFSLFEDGAGRLWAGTRDGLNLFEPARERFRRHFREPGEGGRPGIDSVLGIAEDPRGVLWVALLGTLARRDEASGALVPMPLLTSGVDDKSIAWCIRRARSGALWVGKGSSLFELPAETEQWMPRRVLEGYGGLIVSVESDAAGQLWLGTARGLVRYDPVRGQARRYGAEDGVLDEGFGPGAAFRGSQDEIYFGATGGIAVVRPEDVHVDTAPPPVVFTGLRLSHGALPVGGPLLPRSLSETAEFRLPHEERVFTVEFAALSFRAPRENRFRYRLEGFDPAWQDLPADRDEVTYTNLSPGKYRLLVRAANSDGAWNEAGTSLTLNVLPSWWGTTWFRLLAVGGLAIALVAAHGARTRAVQARNRMLELELRQHREAHEALARSERQLQLIADALPVLIAYLDEDRRFVFANVASETWLRRPRAELPGKRIEEILPADLLPIVAGPVARALAGEGSTFEMEVGAPGARRRIAATLVPHAEANEAFRGFYALAQDLTDRARSEEALRLQQDRLAHASRVLTLGELAAAIAHELNQPLTAILGNAEAAQMLHARAKSPDPEVDDALRDISRDAARGGEIIRKLRDLVRRRESKRDVLDVNLAVRSVEPFLRAGALADEVRLELDLAHDLPEARGDAIQIQQVVLNLARNAVEAMLPVPPVERHLRIRTTRQDGVLVVEVTDSGPPIGDTSLEGLFVPFLSTKTDGLGMGLSISRSIVESHGGEIRAQRNPTGGLTVRFTLPLPGREA